VPGQRGVWVAGQRKIASVGIAVQDWVTFHGFALNVDPDLSVFRTFRPCGLSGEVMTSVARERGEPASVDELRGPIVRAWTAVFAPVDRPTPPEARPLPSAAAVP
jgi:lipoyl synthase